MDTSKKANTEEITALELRSSALVTYINRMTDILIDSDRWSELFSDKDDTNTVDVVRLITTTILQRLENDTQRQGYVLSFLNDASLIEFILSGAKLNDANLCFVNLYSANRALCEPYAY